MAPVQHGALTRACMRILKKYVLTINQDIDMSQEGILI